MIQLTPEESRVLGVLIEKATTTPEQYPLSLNALVNGSNQKNNRDPVLSLSEDQVFDAVESMRGKQLVIRVDELGSRVHKYKHQAGETLRCPAGELAILAELLMRGPQTIGELRGRASRMHPMATLEDAKAHIRGLAERDEPLIKEIAPASGSRADRYLQLLCPGLHPLEESSRSETAMASATTSTAGKPDLSARVALLEHEVAALKSAIRKLASAVGEGDPLESQAISGIGENPAPSDG